MNFSLKFDWNCSLKEEFLFDEAIGPCKSKRISIWKGSLYEEFQSQQALHRPPRWMNDRESIPLAAIVNMEHNRCKMEDGRCFTGARTPGHSGNRVLSSRECVFWSNFVSVDFFAGWAQRSRNREFNVSQWRFADLGWPRFSWVADWPWPAAEKKKRIDGVICDERMDDVAVWDLFLRQ